MLEAQIISYLLDHQNLSDLAQYGVSGEDFTTLPEVFQFLQTYAHEYHQLPDYRTVVARFEHFQYLPHQTDEFKFLCKELKLQNLKRKAFEMLEYQVRKKFESAKDTDFFQWLHEKSADLWNQAQQMDETGFDYAREGKQRLEWYNQAKDPNYRGYIPTPYPSITKALGGGFERGDGCLLMAFTNRGKSWIASHCGITAWQAKFNVLHYAPELTRKQQAYRLDTLQGHFNNMQLRRGNLGEKEQAYTEFLEQFHEESSAASYHIKTMQDLPQGLSIEVIRKDLEKYKNVDMVIIDGFSLMNHGSAQGQNGLMNTSRKLRQLFSYYEVAGLVVHQSNKQGEVNKDETKKVSPPKLLDYSDTIALIQDAATVLTFDQSEGIARICIAKAREPEVGKCVELSADFNQGWIREQDATDFF